MLKSHLFYKYLLNSFCRKKSMKLFIKHVTQKVLHFKEQKQKKQESVMLFFIYSYSGAAKDFIQFLKRNKKKKKHNSVL